MPLDEELDALLQEIKKIKEKPVKTPVRTSTQTFQTNDLSKSSVKKEYLLATEKKAYFQISHHLKLIMLSIEDTATALEIWLKGVLPLLLAQHSLDPEEWERIVDLGDSDPQITKESEENWRDFFQNTIKKGLVDPKILILIKEGRKRVRKMRAQS
ncbi:MAG: hypothetical protein ACFE8U_15930 [Candidatus Hermodarchaeota archaeon]